MAVVGKADELKGQVPIAFCTLKDNSAMDSADKRAALEKSVCRSGETAGCRGTPGRCISPHAYFETRSGKLLRRSIQAVAEGRDPGDLSTAGRPECLGRHSGNHARLNPGV